MKLAFFFFLRNGSRGSHTCDLGVVPQPQDVTLEVGTVFDHATARDRLVYEDGRRMKLHRQTCTVLHSHPQIVGNILLLAHRKYLYTHRHQNQGAYGGLSPPSPTSYCKDRYNISNTFKLLATLMIQYLKKYIVFFGKLHVFQLNQHFTDMLIQNYIDI